MSTSETKICKWTALAVSKENKQPTYKTNNGYLVVKKWNVSKQEMCDLSERICTETIGIGYSNETNDSGSCYVFDEIEEGNLSLPFVVLSPPAYNDDGTAKNILTELYLCAELEEPVIFQWVSGGGNVVFGSALVTDPIEITPKAGIQRWGVTLQSDCAQKVPANTRQIRGVEIIPLNGNMPDFQILDFECNDLLEQAIAENTYTPSPNPLIKSPCAIHSPCEICFEYPENLNGVATRFQIRACFDNGIDRTLGTYTLTSLVSSGSKVTLSIDDSYVNNMPAAYQHGYWVGAR